MNNIRSATRSSFSKIDFFHSDHKSAAANCSETRGMWTPSGKGVDSRSCRVQRRSVYEHCTPPAIDFSFLDKCH